jgi:hypothetical protein
VYTLVPDNVVDGYKIPDEKSSGEGKNKELDMDAINDAFDLSSYPRTEARKHRETASITYLLSEQSMQSAFQFHSY